VPRRSRFIARAFSIAVYSWVRNHVEVVSCLEPVLSTTQSKPATVDALGWCKTMWGSGENLGHTDIDKYRWGHGIAYGERMAEEIVALRPVPLNDSRIKVC
jgi:hypothetical protein